MIFWHLRNGFCVCMTANLKLVIKLTSKVVYVSLIGFFSVIQALSDELQQREIELAAEKKNSLKRDKTIQGLSLVLKEKEKEVQPSKTSTLIP